MEEQKRVYQDDLELIDILRVIWRWKVFLVAVVVATTVVAAGIIIKIYPERTGSQALVVLSFPGIEDGENPDGSLFDKSQMVTPAIVRQAAEAVTGDDAEALLANWRELIQLEAVIPVLKKGEIFFPDSFFLSVFRETEDGRTVLTPGAAGNMIEALLDAYRAVFKKRHMETTLVVADIGIADREPFAGIDAVRQVADYLAVRLGNLEPAALHFRPVQSGQTLNEIRFEVQMLKDIQIPQTVNKILDFSSDSNFVDTYQHLTRQREKKLAEAAAAEKLIVQLPAPSRTEVGESVLLGFSALEKYSRMDVRKYLVEKILSAQIEAENLKVERNALVPPDFQNENDLLKTRALLAELRKDLTVLARTANDLFAGYQQEQIEGTIRRVTEVVTITDRAVNLPLVLALVLAASLFTALFLAFFIDYVRQNRLRP